MTEIDLPLPLLERDHQLGREAVGTEQQQRATRYLGRRIEGRRHPVLSQQGRQRPQRGRPKRLAKQHQPASRKGRSGRLQGIRGQLPPGGR